MRYFHRFQRGVSMIEVALALLLVAFGAIQVANQMTDKIRLNKLNVIVAKINNFSVAVEAYLRDHKNDSDAEKQALDGTVITPQTLASQNYLANGAISAFLTTKDELVAGIKYDTNTRDLRALVYNICPFGACDPALQAVSKMVDAQIGYGGGEKVTENKKTRIRGNFDSWSLKIDDWKSQKIDLSKSSVFKLVKYTPIPNGRFSPDNASVTEMKYILKSAGNVGQSSAIDENKTINWQPLYNNDTLNINWKNNGVSYIILNVKNVTNKNNPIDLETKVVFTSSVTLKSKKEYFGEHLDFVATTYDENGLQGRTFTLHIYVTPYSKPIWKSFEIDYKLDVASVMANKLKIIGKCSDGTTTSGLLHNTDTYFTLLRLVGTLPSSTALPADTTYLEPQKINLGLPDFRGSKKISLTINEPYAITQPILLDGLSSQYDSTALLSLIKLEPKVSQFYSLPVKNCTSTDVHKFNFQIDNVTKSITADPNAQGTYAKRSLVLSSGG